MLIDGALKGPVFPLVVGCFLFAMTASWEDSYACANEAGSPGEKENTKIATSAIQGIVIDMTGRPVENAVVSAYLRPTMNENPVYLSMKTGKDGRYVLRVSGGTYYIKVRSSEGDGPPGPGQIVGYLGERNPAAIAVKEGEIINGVDFKVILFSMRRSPFSGGPPAVSPGPGPGPRQQ